jgi:hypothetical protein
MRSLVSITLAICLFSASAFAQGNTFKKYRYQGGSIASTVKPGDWSNKMTVTSEEILFEFKDGKTYKISPISVTGLSYGQEAHRRVGTMIALAVLVAPLALFGLFHKTRKHYIGMEWQEEGDKKGGVLLQADKDNYRAMLMALRGVTGAKVAVAESERKYIPVGIETVTVSDTEKPKEKEKDKN